MTILRFLLQGLLILALCLGAAEIALRLGALLPAEGAGMRSDPVLGIRGLPHAHGGYGVVTNSRGFHDHEPPRPRIRAAFVGDSFTFGTVPLAEVFPEQVSALLDRGEGYAVANLGISGSGPKEYLRVIDHEVPPLRPEWVVVTLFIGNDILQAHEDYETLLYLGELKMLPKPWLLSLHAEDYYLYRVGRAVLRKIRNRTGLYACADPAHVAALNPRLDPFLSEIYGHELMFYQPQYERLVREAADDLVELTALMAQKIRAQGARPLFVLAPSELQLNQRIRDAIAQCHGIALDGLDFEKPQSWLTERLMARGVAHLDLLPSFRSRDPEALYASKDTHWTAAGNRLAAEQIADYIRARP